MHNTLSSDKLLREPLAQHHNQAPSGLHILSIIADCGLKHPASMVAVSGGWKKVRCRELTSRFRRPIRRGLRFVRPIESRAAETRQSPNYREDIRDENSKQKVLNPDCGGSIS